MAPPSFESDMPASLASEMHLEIPARSVYVGVVRLALASVARQAGLDEDKVDDLRIAVSEACANAVITDEADSASMIKVAWREEPDRIVVEVLDESARQEPASEGAAGEERMAMSLALLRSLVDECSFEPRDGGGMATRLTLHL